jgi:hypothetical protein
VASVTPASDDQPGTGHPGDANAGCLPGDNRRATPWYLIQFTGGGHLNWSPYTDFAYDDSCVSGDSYEMREHNYVKTLGNFAGPRRNKLPDPHAKARMLP